MKQEEINWWKVIGIALMILSVLLTFKFVYQQQIYTINGLTISQENWKSLADASNGNVITITDTKSGDAYFARLWNLENFEP